MRTKRTGYLILRDDNSEFLGPKVGIAYKTRKGAEDALKGWPGITGRVIYMRINIIAERGNHADTTRLSRQT